MCLHYRFAHCDHAKKLDNVDVSELAIDGRLLQEPDSVLLRGSLLEHLYRHLHHTSLPSSLPNSFVHCTKLP